MNKFFFMAIMTANLQGRPQVQFNTVTMLNQRNVLAADLTRIQDAGAELMSANGVTFDDLPIHNLFFLAECTEAEFTAGMALGSMEQAISEAVELSFEADEAAQAEEALAAGGPTLAVDNTANEHVDEAGVEEVTETPVEDVTTADVKPAE